MKQFFERVLFSFCVHGIPLLSAIHCTKNTEKRRIVDFPVPVILTVDKWSNPKNSRRENDGNLSSQTEKRELFVYNGEQKNIEKNGYPPVPFDICINSKSKKIIFVTLTKGIYGRVNCNIKNAKKGSYFKNLFTF